MGCTLARINRDLVPRSLVGAILVLIAVTSVTSYAALTRLYPSYAQLDAEVAAAMLDLGASSTGRVLVVSPTPNVDGWWFEGLTGRPALIGDRLKWYIFEAERKRSIAAQTLVQSRWVLDGGALKLLEFSAPKQRSVMTLRVNDDVEYYPLLQFHGGMEFFEARGQTDGIQLIWRRKPAAASAPSLLPVRIEPPPGVIFRQLSRSGELLTVNCEFLYERFRIAGLEQVVQIEVVASDGWRSSLTGNAIRFDVGAGGTPGKDETLELQVRVRGLQPSQWRVFSQEDLLSRWNVTHVYVRGNHGPEGRFNDTLFERLWKRGTVTAYQVRLPPASPEGSNKY
jgi:hypothetical protein